LIEQTAGPARLQVDPASGGRIASLAVDGLELLLGRSDDPLRWGSYPMAPWAGRVRRGVFRYAGCEYRLPLRMPPHAIHGTTLDRPWRDDGDGRLSIDLGDDWPFAGRATQQFSLDPGGLDVELAVHADDAPFPASLGFHPWFARALSRGDELALDFEARSMYRRDEDGIPTGELVAPPPRPWDDCFTDLVAPPQLRWPGALSVRLESDTDHWVVYDEPEHAICVEPMTGPPDALNLAPRIVAPGDPLVVRMRIAWTIE